ncbi:uncharacterized protein A4U43_C03F18460 [Asparagus officinalis]|uniref:Replication factor A C-terminal domain-containing protein n=1 Tax=Asparagus officinalis TaxID=4686 RepID=A0A5P1FB32_ASPOF|nr:uncharacterized protein A4U43_C03F18460 [Asparagus officinalis]
MESNDEDHHPNCPEVIYDATLVVCNTQQCTSITQSSDEDVNLMCSTSGTGYTQIDCQKTPTETYARAFSVDEAKLTREVEQSFIGNNTVSSSSASRVYINFDDPKVKDLSQRNLNESEELLQIIPTPVNYSSDQPQLIKAANGTLNDLLFFNDPGTSNEYYFICEVIIIGIIEHMKWRYSGCPDCSKKSLIAGNSLWCEKCNKQVMAQNCYKITLEVEDYSAVSTITLFNREAEKLFKVSADEMAKNLVKIKGKEVFPPLIKGIVGKKIKVQIKLTKYNYIEGNEGFTVMKLIDDLHDGNKESYIENTPQDVFATQYSDVISLTEEGPPTTPLTTPISKSVLKNTTNVMIKPKIEKAVNNNLVVNNSIEVEEKTGSIEQLKLTIQEGKIVKIQASHASTDVEVLLKELNRIHAQALMLAVLLALQLCTTMTLKNE